MEDKMVLCPYCGAWNGYPNGCGMKLRHNNYPKSTFPNKSDELVYYYHCPECGCDSPEAPTEEEAYERAVFRFETPPKPLTAEEVKRGGDLWVEIRRNHTCYATDLTEEMEYGKEMWVTFQDPLEHVAILGLDDYEKTWRAWRLLPTTQKMTDTPWEGDRKKVFVPEIWDFRYVEEDDDGKPAGIGEQSP